MLPDIATAWEFWTALANHALRLSEGDLDFIRRAILSAEKHGRAEMLVVFRKR